MAKNSPPTLNMEQLPIERVQLNVPSLSQIIQALLPELSKNFVTVTVEAVQCPDLTQPPFRLASQGLSGNETVIDIGSVKYQAPMPNMNKIYDFRDFKRVTECDPLFIIGACAGPWPLVGVSCEMIGNVHITNNHVNNGSHIYKLNPANTEEIVHENLPQNDTRFVQLGNLYTSNGLEGEVLKIVCETRKGPTNFVISIREALVKYFGNDIVALGGVILIENGKVKLHVMADFLKTPIETEADWNKWLKRFDVSTPLVGVGYIISHDQGLDLRPQHFHLFSDHGVGGHYHYDTEPTTIKYTAYLKVAKNLIKIDHPRSTINKK